MLVDVYTLLIRQVWGHCCDFVASLGAKTGPLYYRKIKHTFLHSGIVHTVLAELVIFLHDFDLYYLCVFIFFYFLGHQQFTEGTMLALMKGGF